MPVFEKAFSDHLSGQFDHFGLRESETFAAARGLYFTAVLKDVKVLIDERAGEKTVTNLELRVHSVLVERLKALFHDSDRKYPKAPIWLPLLCPAYLLHISDLLLSLDFAFELVSKA